MLSRRQLQGFVMPRRQMDNLARPTPDTAQHHWPRSLRDLLHIHYDHGVRLR
jgi:hypothetical protein